ncbi:YbaB/EbfC family nucleoid-associated protein [Bacillus sp. ISL-4]|uniref:YbaB/EbfC family nucleoid-associated protein n=1 Tax=Bacillus sp. ISL-4 TaxID=2819125 RepID=UPI001BE8F5F8|nr:YbaB/EbfC family nucleoid-associated protein [Bacillus sp. ISL-4]MBT2667300.1 YbaB/EbfC family nucleoid-associated protein [Bacillus sp. ISL-4]
MVDMKLNEAVFKTLKNEMFTHFTNNRFGPVESSVDELVSISIDADFQVRSVSLRGLDLDSSDVCRLEEAILTAFNNAVREVVNRNGENFTQVLHSAINLNSATGKD